MLFFKRLFTSTSGKVLVCVVYSYKVFGFDCKMSNLIANCEVFPETIYAGFILFLFIIIGAEAPTLLPSDAKQPTHRKRP